MNELDQITLIEELRNTHPFTLYPDFNNDFTQPYMLLSREEKEEIEKFFLEKEWYEVLHLLINL